MPLGKLSLLLAAALLAAGCTPLNPRFSQEIATSFARDDMRRMQTPQLEVYYPAQRRDEALRIAGRIGFCIEQLRLHAVSKTPRPRVVMMLTSANFDNAYMEPQVFGLPQQLVLPVNMNLQLFQLVMLPGTDIADVSCHEVTHYVHLQQNDGLWRGVDAVFGDYLQPNVFMDSWFDEGLAEHYEGRLGREVGRPWNPLYHGMFLSGAAARRGQLGFGDLAAESRDEAPFGGNYLVGEQFVDYLANKYGDDKLWQVIDKQGHSWFSPFGVALRFKSVYGESVGALFDDFTASLQGSVRARPRPAGQKVLAEVGYLARLASAPDGSLATVEQRRDSVSELVIRGPDDVERLRVPLKPLLPERPYLVSSPALVSGLSFSRDGRSVFVVLEDVAEDGAYQGKLVQLDAQTGALLGTFGGLHGTGGDLRPDGAAYTFVETDGDRARLVELELASGKRRTLAESAPGQDFLTPSYSPDGARLAYIHAANGVYDVVVREPDGSSRAVLASRRLAQEPRWLDADHLVFLGSAAGRAQAELVDLRSGALKAVTDAPYAAFEPVPRPGGRIAFLNRVGWGFTLDEVALADAPPPAPDDGAATPQPPATAPVQVESDGPYHATDHLWLPNLWGPTGGGLVGGTGRPTRYLLGLGLQGGDRLGYNLYAANVTVESQLGLRDVALGYANDRLAPWLFSVTASQQLDDTATVGNLQVPLTVRDRELRLEATRTFWTTPVTLSAVGLRRDETADGFEPYRVNLVGAGLSTSYAATDGSMYAGAQRGFTLGLSLQGFPAAFGSTSDLAELRGSTRVYLPQPLARGSLSMLLTGHALTGGGDSILQVGGQGGLIGHGLQQGRTGPVVDLPQDLEFTEPVRGFEDVAFRGYAAEVGGLDYHYPFIVDRGTASILWVLPGLYVSQVDLDVFGRGLRVLGTDAGWRASGGATLTLNLRIGELVATQLFYEVAERTDGLGLLHAFGFSVPTP